MQVIKEDGVPIKAWVDGVQLEDEARKQLLNVSKLPFIYRWVAAMPDVHWGRGATVGSVIPTERAIIPAAVGVDIGCGMMAVKLKLVAEDLPDSLSEIRASIEKAVPHGRTNNGGKGDRGAWGEPPKVVVDSFLPIATELEAIRFKHPKIAGQNDIGHLGTLGTGNHFIEICLDESNSVWVILHSGSRGIGNRIGSYFIELAKKEMQKWMINLPDADLAYLPEGSEYFSDYIKAVRWAQEFALTNRCIMMQATVGAIGQSLGRELYPAAAAVNCHHNYVQKENHFGKNVWITRKGAVSARQGELGIIPGSMGTKSYIVSGLGNPESFMSCSHGAGRQMSRGQAKKLFTLEDHILATAGVECRKDVDVLDETPGAYKDIDAVMAAQADLVKIEHTLKQILCVKG